jgi:AcrR family transcriptional regulator
MATQRTDFSPKKWPRQARSRATFDAIVEAAARLLAERGYTALTTNHIAEQAGVGIASLYEYFPDKDAVVARVADRLVQGVMTRLGGHMEALLQKSPQDAMPLWIEAIYQTLHTERELVAVFMYQVPFTNRLPAVRHITEVLMDFSDSARQRAGVELARPRAELHLIINLVSSTILQLILEPPEDVSVKEMKAALAEKVAQWLL